MWVSYWELSNQVRGTDTVLKLKLVFSCGKFSFRERRRGGNGTGAREIDKDEIGCGWCSHARNFDFRSDTEVFDLNRFK